MLLLPLLSFAQINYSYGWEPTGLGDWVNGGSSGSFSRSTTTPCLNLASARANNYYGGTSILTSPVLSGTNGGPLTVSFSYKVTQYYTNSMGASLDDFGELKIEWAASSAGPWTIIDTIDSSEHIVSASCATKTVSFSGPPSGGNVFVRFVFQAGEDADNYVYLDDVLITQGVAPSCLAPFNVLASNITNNSATIEWAASPSTPSEGYMYEVRTDTNPGTSGSALIASGTTLAGVLTASISNLSELTNYNVYVRSNCGSGDLSFWSSKVVFRTTCNNVIAPTVVETFSTFTGSISATSLPCWQKKIGAVVGDALTGTASNWSFGDYNNSSTNPNGKALYINLYGDDKEWMISPSIDLGTTSGPNFRLKYDVSVIPYSGSSSVTSMGADKSVTVLISTDNGQTWSSTNILKVYNDSNIPYNLATPEIIDLSAYSGVVKFAFFAKSTTTSIDLSFYIDNFVIEPLPACSDISGLQVSDVTKNAAKISWNVPNPLPGIGYEYEVRTSGEPGTPGAIFTGAVSSSELFHNLVNLLPSTQYTVYFRTACSVSQFGLWSSGITFTTLCDYPDLVSAPPVTRCGIGTVNLSADFNSSHVFWFDNAVSGNVLAITEDFTTPQLSATTTYYATGGNVSTTPSLINAGAGDLTSSSYSNPFYSNWSNNHTQHLITARELLNYGVGPGAINSIALDVTSIGTLPMINLSIKIGTTTRSALETFDTNAVMSSVFTSASYLPTAGVNTFVFTTPFVWDGKSNIIIEFCHGNSASSATISRTIKSVATSYKSTVKAHVSSSTSAETICANTSSNLESYLNRPQFIFNANTVCVNATGTAVVATVTPAPVLTLSTNSVEICEGQTATVTVTAGASDYDTFVWTPSTGVTGNQTTGWVFNPVQTTNYTLIASQESGSECSMIVELTVEVNELPDYVQLDATYDACANQSLELNPNVVANKEFVIGTGVTLTGATDTSTAFMNRWPQTKQQYIYTKTELNAIGINGGEISYLAFKIASLGDGATNANYTIKIKSISESSFANSTFVTGGFTTVFGPVTYTHTATGWQVFNLTTPFNWDGNSNILIELTHNGANSSNNAQTYYTTTTDDKGLGAQSATAFTTTTGTLTVKRLNVKFRPDVVTTATWTPQTNLFIDQAATQPYTGGHASKVYVKSAQANSTVYTLNMVTDQGCASSLTTTVNVTAIADPIVADQTFCEETDVTDVIVTGQTGATLKWFTTLTSTDEITSITTTGTYYVEQILNNCVSARVAVDISIKEIAVAPVVDLVQNFCGIYTIADLEAQALTGNTIAWFSSLTSTVELVSTQNLTTGTYFVAQTNGSCWSPRVEVEVSVNAVPAVPINTSQEFCGIHTLADVNLGQAAGATLNWYSSATSTSILPLTTQIVSGDYYVSQVVNNCESAKVVVTMTVLAVLPAPTASLNQSYCSAINFADLEVTVAQGAVVGWFTSQNATTPLPLNQSVATGTYYVSQYNGACWSPKTQVEVFVGSVPTNPNNNPLTLCGNYNFGQLSLGQSTGASLNWYVSQVSTTPIPLTSEVISGVYYVSQSVGVCESSRVPISITITASLGLPTAVTQTFCGSGTVGDLIAEGVANAQLLWYSSMVSPSALPTNTALSTGTYYVAQTVNGCVSERKAVAVRVISLEAPMVSPFTICGSGIVSDLYIPAATGVTYKWFTSPSNQNELAQNTPLSTGVYYVSKVQAGCVSQRTAVQVTIGDVPSAPTGVATQIFVEGSTLANIIMDQPNITWYSTYNDVLNGINPLALNMPLINGMTYYAVIIGTNGCPSLPFAVTVSVYLSNDEFEKDRLKYYPNPVNDILNVDYVETIKSIEVFDLLGKRVKSVHTNNENVQIDLSELASGTYMIQLRTESKTQFIKVVKK